jgi:hypothetical protein
MSVNKNLDAYNNLDDCTSEQLEQLKKKSFWLDEKRCTDEFIDSLKCDLLKNFHRPIVFEEEALKKIMPITLLEQFKKIEPTKMLLHNFDSETNLLNWQCYDAIELFFAPIHYQIYQRKNTPIKQTTRLTTLFDLQNVLISSHFKTTHFSARDIISQLEIFIDAVLMEIFLYNNAVVFLFDWKDARTYALLVCFKIDQIGLKKSVDYISFDRNTLFDDIVEEVATADVDLDMAKMRETLRALKLSYHYYGFARRI